MPIKKLLPNNQNSTEIQADLDINFSEFCKETGVKPLNNLNKNFLIPVKASKLKIDYPNTKNDELNNLEFYGEYTSHKEFYRHGQRLLTKQLRSGKIIINASLDLHSFRQIEAINLLEQFLIKNKNTSGCLKIIHGKGNNSANNNSVLLHFTRKWLELRPEVLAYTYGNANQGGDGVTLVKLMS